MRTVRQSTRYEAEIYECCRECQSDLGYEYSVEKLFCFLKVIIIPSILEVIKCFTIIRFIRRFVD